VDCGFLYQVQDRLRRDDKYSNMKTIKINLNKITKDDVSLIVEYLKQGKVIAYPTDTVYGLGCDCRNVEAIKRIKKIKGEKGIKPLLVLISDFQMLKKYCFVNTLQMEYLKKYWPGPVTVVLNLKKNLPRELTAGTSSLAVRLPKSEFLFKIITGVGQPIVSTSLNISGQKSLNNLNNLDNYFKKVRPDLVVDAGTVKKTQPSKLVDLRNITDIRILRK